LVFFSSVLSWRGAMSNAVDLNLNFVRSEKIQKLPKNYPLKKQLERESETWGGWTGRPDWTIFHH